MGCNMGRESTREKMEFGRKAGGKMGIVSTEAH
jgi:hypothetical protein